MAHIDTNLVLVTVTVVTAIAGWIDLRTGKIPNEVVVGGFVVGIAMHLWVHAAQAHPESFSDWGYPLFNIGLGIIACGVVPFCLFWSGAMGGGDTKLLAVIGATLGPIVGLQIEFYAFIALALFAPIKMAYEGRILQLLGNMAVMAANPFRAKENRRAVPRELMTKLRFGPAVFAATALVSVLRWRLS